MFFTISDASANSDFEWHGPAPSSRDKIHSFIGKKPLSPTLFLRQPACVVVWQIKQHRHNGIVTCGALILSTGAPVSSFNPCVICWPENPHAVHNARPAKTQKRLISRPPYHSAPSRKSSFFPFTGAVSGFVIRATNVLLAAIVLLYLTYNVAQIKLYIITCTSDFNYNSADIQHSLGD